MGLRVLTTLNSPINVGGNFEHLIQSILKSCLLVFILKFVHDQTTFKYRCSIKTSDLMLPTYMACCRPT